MSLPSYEEAIVHSRDISNILESYLDTSSLRNIVLVDKDHNKKYAKYLWADPIVRIAEGSKPFSMCIHSYSVRGLQLTFSKLVLSSLSTEPRISTRQCDQRCTF